jgi:hypothetical protein
MIGFASEDDFRRVADAVKAVERDRGRSALSVPYSRAPAPAAPVFVDVATTTVATGYYDGHFLEWDEDAEEWVEQEECYVRDANGGSLAVGNYLGRVVGNYPDDTGRALVQVDAGAAAWFFALITGGSNAAGYSWKRINLTSPHSWVDATDPAPLTGSANAWRAPSNTPAVLPTGATGPPDIPVDQAVLIRPSPTVNGQFEVTPWGGLQTFSCTVVTNVACVSGSIVQTTKTLKIMGRDLAGSLD